MEDQTLGADRNMATQFALHVALQTMKERCISLQKQLTSVEEENRELRDRLETDSNIVKVSSSSGIALESYQLRTQVQDLNRQKMQLSEHINMVSAENRKLWSRLSQIAKDQNSDSGSGAGPAMTENNCTLSTEATSTAISRAGCSNLNLIRSKTFTQHSPNPNLRHKMIPCENASDGMKDISLEEIALDTYEDHEIGAGEAYAVEAATEADLGFSYLNIEGSDIDSDGELKAETKKCIEGLEEMRSEALMQQHELKATLKMIQNKMMLNRCPECENKSKKPEMADKSLETDESFTELKIYNERKTPSADAPQTQESKQNVDDKEKDPPAPETTTRLNILQEKVQADDFDKICPMCGKAFSNAVSFNSFREHVETHFIDDSDDADQSIDRNFELISHAVGDF